MSVMLAPKWTPSGVVSTATYLEAHNYCLPLPPQPKDARRTRTHRRHRAKHGSNMWDRRSSRVADGATNDAAAPPPPAMGMPTYPPNKGPYDGAPAAGPVPM